MNIRILIADDSPVMRKAVRELLATEASIEIVGEAVSYEQMLSMKEQYRPDIVVMDLHMMEEGDIPPVAPSENSKVLAISVCDPNEGGRKANDLGAAAFLDKLNLYNTLIPKIIELREAM